MGPASRQGPGAVPRCIASRPIPKRRFWLRRSSPGAVRPRSEWAACVDRADVDDFLGSPERVKVYGPVWISPTPERFLLHMSGRFEVSLSQWP